MTIARMFELVTDCLVCIGFSFLRFGFCFGFSGVFVVVPVHVRKRKGRLKPATTAQFFLIASRLCCKNPSIVLDFAPSSSLYDDAPHPRDKRSPNCSATGAAETRERWRSCSRWCNPNCTGSPTIT